MAHVPAEPELRYTDVLGDRWLLALVAVGFIARVTAAVLTDPGAALIADDRIYVSRALRFLETGEFETGLFVRPPLYFLLLAATRLLSEPWGLPWLLTTKLLQCSAGVLTALPVYRTTRRAAGRTAARLAAGFLLFDPTLIAYTHLLWPETVFAMLAAFVFDAVARLGAQPGWRALALGMLTGLAMLLKPVFGLFAAILATSWLLRLGPRRAIRLALVFGGAALVVISPWVVRNQIRYGPAVILENQASFNLWVGNDARSHEEVVRQWRSLEEPATRSRAGAARGLAAIGADLGGFARRCVRRAINLWGLEYFVVLSLIRGGYGEIGKGALLFWFWVIQGAYVLVLLSAACGLEAAWRKSPEVRLVAVYAAALTLIVAAMVATTRFRVPLGFLFCVAAGIGARGILEEGLTRRRLIPLVLALVVLGVSASRPVFRPLALARFETVAELRHPEWIKFRY